MTVELAGDCCTAACTPVVPVVHGLS